MNLLESTPPPEFQLLSLLIGRAQVGDPAQDAVPNRITVMTPAGPAHRRWRAEESLCKCLSNPSNCHAHEGYVHC